MDSTAPRLLTLLASIALVASFAAAPAPAAPKKCAKGKTAWKLEGRSVCVARARLGAGAGSANGGMARAWIVDASRRVPGGRLRLPGSLRRAVPKAARKAAGAVTSGSARTHVAQNEPPVQTFSERVARQDLGGGVTLEGKVRTKGTGTGPLELDVDLELRDRKGRGVRYSPLLKDFGQNEAPVGCPTADGRVSVEPKIDVGGTTVALDGNRVLAAKTIRHRWSVRARGQVGPDARLQSVDADVVGKSNTYERGLQIETTVRAPVSLSREGAPSLRGAPAVDVRIRRAGSSRDEERGVERSWARQMAGAQEIAGLIGTLSADARKRLLEAEPGWYEVPNNCAQLDWTPAPGGTLEPQQTRGVKGHVVATRDGGVATGSIAITSVARGNFIPITSAFSPGSPASYIAASAEPDASHHTVYASAIATSTAGRAGRSWFAGGTPADLPRSFSGTVSSTSTYDSLTREFSGTATFTRTSLVRGPDGSLNAYYELTSAFLTEAKETIGPTKGCRIEATGSGGYIDSGDLEVRVLSDGSVVYALLYDLKLETTFEPTDCPPGGFAYDGAISAFLNSRIPGPVEDQMRPAGDGYVLEEENVSDVTDVPGRVTSASWSLSPE